MLIFYEKVTVIEPVFAAHYGQWILEEPEGIGLMEELFDKTRSGRHWLQWKQRYGVLIEEGYLQIESAMESEHWNRHDNTPLRNQTSLPEREGVLNAICLSAYLAKAEPTPDDIWMTDAVTDADRIMATNHATVTALIPQIASVHGDEIMEIRRRVADVRLGYHDFLRRELDQIEDRMRSGATFEQAVDRHVQRQIATHFRELQRVMTGRRQGFWAKLLSTGSKCLQINATPFTPLFYGQLLEAFGVSVGAFANDVREHLDRNDGQMLQFLGRTQETLRGGSD